MNKYRTEWGDKVKSELCLKRMTLKQLGEITGLDPTYCSAIISGGRNSEPAQKKISEALGIPFEEYSG